MQPHSVVFVVIVRGGGCCARTALSARIPVPPLLHNTRMQRSSKLVLLCHATLEAATLISALVGYPCAEKFSPLSQLSTTTPKICPVNLHLHFSLTSRVREPKAFPPCIQHPPLNYSASGKKLFQFSNEAISTLSGRFFLLISTRNLSRFQKNRPFRFAQKKTVNRFCCQSHKQESLLCQIPIPERLFN